MAAQVTPVFLRDISWIRGALQTAVALEHSTMPLYCAAMYSLEVQNYPSYNTIRSVLMEEMVHMAIAANMVAALGGTPRIATLDPVYATRGLPGGVAPDLPVILAQLSPRSLENFMRLEAPDYLLDSRQRAAVYPTIGAFYDAIREAVDNHKDALRRAVEQGGPSNQIGGNLGYLTFEPAEGVDPVEKFHAGLDLITEQGEGRGTGTVEAGEDFQREGSHYARFAELRYGRRYLAPEAGAEITRENEAAFFQGEEIVWPVVINTLAVPSDGYAAVLAEDPDAAEVRKELERFDNAYTEMMACLDRAWNGPAETWWPSLGAAVTQMDQMRVSSCFTIMRHRVPAQVIGRLEELYPRQYKALARYTELSRPVFYGPRFINNNGVR
ncbi:ferritin-like domain-containing protein [Streptomyces albofaciens]|uniref:ferritin-like domain-containing protein n=1 Tax=Streptomyces albofaciens TaxID=66866 RepID=UPI001AD6A95A|nr:ferritin-like protein [Streptomyces albofaciens]